MKIGWTLALLLAWPVPFVVALAEPANLPIDPVRSQATFSVRKLWFAHARGAFPHLHGTLRRVATDGGERIAVDASVSVAGLSMHDAADRARALGAAFFDAARFPVIRFASAPFAASELARGGTLRGTLLLHGVEREVTFTLSPSTCPRQPLRCAIVVTGVLRRSDFGMHASRALVGDKVQLGLTIRLVQQP